MRVHCIHLGLLLQSSSRARVSSTPLELVWSPSLC
jgi:hypothetical protein